MRGRGQETKKKEGERKWKVGRKDRTQERMDEETTQQVHLATRDLGFWCYCLLLLAFGDFSSSQI